MSPLDSIDSRLLDLLACPRDYTEFAVDDRHLVCGLGHRYPVVSGVPVLLLAECEPTLGIEAASLRAADNGVGGPLYLDTIAVPIELKRHIVRDWNAHTKVDAVVSYLLGATAGQGYVKSVGRLQSYPIPDIPVGPSDDERLLDIGSSWGRWSLSAARKGWQVVGLDPSLGAIMAARRVIDQFVLDMSFVCADARFLPFKADVFRCVFSYSVIQHFSELDAELALAEAGRVLCRGGLAKIQMAHRGGVRSTYCRTRRAYSGSGRFRVRYWSLASLRDVFERKIGRSALTAEAFGGLGLLAEDRSYVSIEAKILIAISTCLKALSIHVRWLIRFADSVYVESVKQ